MQDGPEVPQVQASERPGSPHRLTRRDTLLLTGTAAASVAMPTAARAARPDDAGDGPVQTAAVRLTVNGQVHPLQVDTRHSLLDLLRETLQLTGTKKGCNQGACGACTVLLNGRRVNACLTLAAMLDGAEVVTIEGLAVGDELHPLQAAFIEHEGFQCGYCTAGQIMSAAGCIGEGHAGSPEEIAFWMSGNICRCGAYPGIVAAIADVAGQA